MSHTTPEMIAAMRSYANKLKELPGVKDASVDDWNKFASFSILIYIDPKDSKLNLRSITKHIRTLLKEVEPDARVRSFDSPRKTYSTYTYRGHTDRYFEGRERDYIALDVDYFTYNKATNTFLLTV